MISPIGLLTWNCTGSIVCPISTVQPCMKLTGSFCLGVGGADEGGGQTSSSHALYMGWQVAFLSKYKMTCASGPSSLWCGMCMCGLYQQLAAIVGGISTFNMLVKASTNNETLRVKFLPIGIQHLPSAASVAHWRAWAYASSQSWTYHPHPLTSLLRNCPMFKMVGAGRQIKGLKVLAIQHHAASSLHARAYAATSLPSVRGQTNSHHSISVSSIFPLHCSSHLLILHRGSTFCEGGDDAPWHGDDVMACCVPPYFILSE